MTPRKRDSGAPAPGGGSFAVSDLGEPQYHTAVGPERGVLRPVPTDTVAVTDAGEPQPAASATVPLVPASEEVAKLPRLAREALAARCAARVEALRAGVNTPEAAAALLLAAATVETPIRKQLLCIRRDFDRIAALVRDGNWTDATPVPSDAFGPLWPKNFTPEWAQSEPPGGAI